MAVATVELSTPKPMSGDQQESGLQVAVLEPPPVSSVPVRPVEPEVYAPWDFRAYREVGGTLDEKYFQKVQQVLVFMLVQGELEESSPEMEKYAKSMAQRAGVTLTGEQSKLFGYLRQLAEEVADPIGRMSETGVPTLYSDSALLAQILLLTQDRASYRKMNDYFPSRPIKIEKVTK